MQTSRSANIPVPSTEDADLLAQADAFESHWAEVVRFVLKKKGKIASYSGPEADLSHVELAALTALDDRDHRMGDLAARIGLSESSATRLVDRLVAGGFVERRTSAADRRTVTAGLTPSGKRTMKKVHAGRRDFLKEILATLRPGERAE